MQSLGETTARLRAARRAPPVGAPAHARFKTTAEFGANPGLLRMTSYAPAGLGRGRPLVVVLHGCTQSAEGYAGDAGWVALADRLQFAVVAPEQTSANNPNRCFNWFVDEDIARGTGEAASIAAMVRRATDDFGSDPGQVFVTGLSAGGAMTAVMLATYPDLFAGGAIVAGLPYGVARSMPEAMQAMHRTTARDADELAALVLAAAPPEATIPPLAIWHGDADWTVNVSNGEALARQWAGLQSLAAQTAETEAFPTHRRSTWRAAGAERASVELNIVHGLGHGAPISTGRADSVGKAGPFVLDAGVSSTLEIARFWGLAPAAAFQARAETPAPAEPAPERPTQPDRGGRLGDQVMAAVSPHIPAAVSDVISKALRTAGLL